MAELTINWEPLDKVPAPAPVTVATKPVVTGEKPVAAAPDATPAEEPAAPDTTTVAASDKPYLIYVLDSTTEKAGFDTVEKVILDDDRVKLGCKAFHAVKMTPEAAKADPFLAEKGGKAVPRIIFVSADYKTVKPLEGATLKLGEVWGTMKATANRFYKQDLDSVIKDLKSVLIEFDKINKERTVLEEKEKRLTDKTMTPADKKDIEAKKAELDARQAKATAAKDKLWELKPKDAPKAT